MIFILQVLGQAALGFKLSIAQITVTVGVCAIVEGMVTFRRTRTLVWPASGILTGNSVAFILRASGTRHGDWWSLRGIQYFVLAALLSLASKYLVRPGGRHLFNPSNIGIVWTLLVIGPAHVFPQYLWWGPFGSWPVMTALAVILIGGYWVLKPVGMVPMAMAYLFTFAVLVGLFALAGRSFIAIWHDGPIRGAAYWADICLSPEVLIFVFFMMSDPQTAPKTPRGRIIYGAGTAAVASGLLVFQTTEFGIKLSILSALTVLCALGPAIQRRTQPSPAGEPETVTVSPPRIASPRRWLAAAARPAVASAAIIAVAAPLDTAALIANKQVVNIERGLTGARNPQ